MSLFETLATATKPENAINTNGHLPAFPRIAFGNDGCVSEVAHGLTKRELFAAMAMQGNIAKYGSANPADTAGNSVLCADALIKALNQE